MFRFAICRFGILLLLVALSPTASAQTDDGMRELPDGSFSGSIAINGCEVSAGDLRIRARPALPPRGAREPADPRPRPRRSFVIAAEQVAPGRFAFRFDHLREGAIYRLGIKLVGRSERRCGRLVWRADRPSFVSTGEVPLAFEAHAVTAEIEVWGPAADGRRRARWLAADRLDLADAASGSRLVRWRTSLPEAVGGRLQVSLRPFPRPGNRSYTPCASEPGAIVHEADISVIPGEWATIAVDFHALLADGRAASTDTGRLTPLARAAFDAGRPLHIRVLPQDGRQPICAPERAGIPPEVLLAKAVAGILNPPPGPPVFSIEEFKYFAPGIDLKHPKGNETCYRVTRDYAVPELFAGGDTSTYWDFMTVDNSAAGWGSKLEQGFSFCVPNDYGQDNDDGFLESFANTFGSVLTGFVDLFGKLVNFASGFWEDIQNYAVDAVAKGLEVIPGVCDTDACRDALEMGLEVGLATMGVPPSLPDFDQLVDQGADYLMAQAGSQLGVPSALTDYASASAQTFIKKAVKSMQDHPYTVPGLPDWLAPHIGFEPALLTLRVYGSGDALPSQPAILRGNDPIYAGKFIQLPRRLPKKGVEPGLVFPMVLEPNLAGLPAAPTNYDAYRASVWDKNQWRQNRYMFGSLQGCYHLTLTGLAPLGDHVFPLADFAFTTQTADSCGYWSVP